MQFGRVVIAHIFAVMLGSFLLLVGLEIVVFGLIGFLQGFGKWFGGILIFGILSVISIPLGLTLRWAVGLLSISPAAGAAGAGLFVGLALLFVLHPTMYPPMSIWSHAFSLTIVHSIAGVSAGLLWYMIETCGGEQRIV